MNKHECIIGIWHDYEGDINVTFTELKEVVNDEMKIHICRQKCKWYNEKPYILQDYLNLQKHTNFNHYTYCPICGKKIDWAKLREENK